MSIFTPSHNPKYLPDLYASIKEQPFDEWLIAANNGCVIPQEITQDPRVRVVRAEHIPSYVGALKRFACEQCTGDVLIECDHDDLLTPTAISDIRQAFEDPSIGFVYSNSANFKDDFQPTPKYGSEYGWRYRDFDHQGHKLDEAIAFPLYPSGVSKIWYCPNHVRAWRKEAYWQAGGHPQDMRVLDDQDLIARTYLVAKFHHIDKCLYLYRITGENTWLKYNQEIQQNVMRIHDIYLERIALKWAKDNGLLALDMGAYHRPTEGFKSCDIRQGCDFQFDASGKWPFEDNSVGVIRAVDFMEHIPDKIHLINEMYRVLAHGGMLLSETPSTDGRGAFQDPTHCAYYNEHSFWYYTQSNMAAFVPEIKARFQTDVLTTYEPRPNIPYVKAYLVAMKGGDLPGLCGWPR